MEAFSSSYVWASISQPRKNFKGQSENLLSSFFPDRFFLRWDGKSREFALCSCSRGGNNNVQTAVPSLNSLSPLDVPFRKLLNYPISWVFYCLFIRSSQKFHFCLAGKALCQMEVKLLSKRLPRERWSTSLPPKILIIPTLEIAFNEGKQPQCVSSPRMCTRPATELHACQYVCEVPGFVMEMLVW